MLLISFQKSLKLVLVVLFLIIIILFLLMLNSKLVSSSELNSSNNSDLVNISDSSNSSDLINFTGFTSFNYDLSIEANVPRIIYINLLYNDLFKIRNLDHERGEKESLKVNVNYWLYKLNNNSQNYFQNTSRNTFRNYSRVLYLNSSFMIEGLNSYKTSGTGEFSLTSTGDYILCAKIKESFYRGEINNDSNEINDLMCFNFTAIDSSKIPCNVSLDLEISKNIVNNSEKIKINNIISNEEFPYIIEYRVVDIFGDIVRLKTTENNNKKSYTPKITSKLAAYYIENELLFVACNNSNNKISNKELLLILNEDYEDETSSSLIDSNNKLDLVTSSLELQQIYGNKIFFGDKLKVKFKITKGDTRKTLVELFLENKEGKKLSEVVKYYVYDKYKSVTITSSILLNNDPSLETGTYYLVLQGLGLKETKKIKINQIQILNNTNENIKNSDLDLKINSFYTLNKKYSPNNKINLYINLKEPKEIIGGDIGFENISLILRGEQDYFSKSYIPGKNRFEVNLFEKNNLFTAVIINNKTNEVYDYKELFLKVINDSIIKVNSFNNFLNEDLSEKLTTSVEEILVNNNNNNYNDNRDNNNLISNNANDSYVNFNGLNVSAVFTNDLITSAVVRKDLSFSNSQVIFSSDGVRKFMWVFLILVVFLSLGFLLSDK